MRSVESRAQAEGRMGAGRRWALRCFCGDRRSVWEVESSGVGGGTVALPVQG